MPRLRVWQTKGRTSREFATRSASHGYGQSCPGIHAGCSRAGIGLPLPEVNDVIARAGRILRGAIVGGPVFFGVRQHGFVDHVVRHEMRKRQPLDFALERVVTVFHESVNPPCRSRRGLRPLWHVRTPELYATHVLQIGISRASRNRGRCARVSFFAIQLARCATRFSGPAQPWREQCRHPAGPQFHVRVSSPRPGCASPWRVRPKPASQRHAT